MVTLELRTELNSSSLELTFGPDLSVRSREFFLEVESAGDSELVDSKDFFLSAMVKEEDLEAGRARLCLGELVSSGGSDVSALTELALLFLQALRTFCLLTASTEFFLRTRGLTSVFSLCLAPGEVGGVQLRQEREDLPLETALSLSELELSSEFFFPIGGFEAC